MKQFFLWFRIIRPQTLFASLCPVLVGLLVASHHIGSFNWRGHLTAIFTILCSLALQILSNLINDYYDYKRGTDKKGRVLITTLTKKTAEALSEYLIKEGIKARYLHSEITSIERIEILRDLRLGEFDVLVGVNLLREGLDIPEVSLVIITDADKEGFLRSETSLIQTIGRAARNADSKVIMYADKITDSMKVSIDETARRRKIQIEYNKKHGITPKTIIKPVENNLLTMLASFRNVEDVVAESMAQNNVETKDLPKLIAQLEKEMKKSAGLLDFERAAEIRDKLAALRNLQN